MTWPSAARPIAPYLAGLKFELFDSKDGEIAAFKSGAVDLAFDMTQADYATIQGTDPTVGTAELQPAWQYEHLDLNNDPNKARGNGLWMPDVRKAIAMAVNKTGPDRGRLPRRERPAGLLADPSRPVVRQDRDLPGLRRRRRQRAARPDHAGRLRRQPPADRGQGRQPGAVHLGR